ncbi:pseudouridine synthase [Azonexus sp.]|uniref:pseudouridine synthase n=1 Tax=Azonexus sp. TaxID=1872668 RepID=UPI0035B2CE37
MQAYHPPIEGPSVVHVDDQLLVVDKPSGLLSVPGRGADKQDCVISRLQRNWPEAMIAHRLDMSTSGLLVVARGEAMQREMYRLFRERAVDKRYVAAVAGLIADDVGEIDLPLICDWPNRPRQMVSHELGKPSLTRFRVLSRDPARNATVVELEPLTGRSHQLRVHLAALGHPILGDDLYAGSAAGRAARLLLHAAEIAFPHPAHGRLINFHCPAPFIPLEKAAITL